LACVFAISLLPSPVFHCYPALYFITVSLQFHYYFIAAWQSFICGEKLLKKTTIEPKYTKIILIAAFINEINPKYLTKHKFLKFVNIILIDK